MRAVRWFGRGDVRVVDVPPPDPPRDDEITVSVAACGLCGTDVHEYLHGPILVPLEPHPVTGGQAPLTLGHEIAGWVRAVGAGVSSPAIGELVVLNALLPCSTCPPCLVGEPQRCLTLGHLGLNADGGLADQVTVPASMAVAAAGLNPEVAVLAEPFAVAVHAVSRAGDPTDTDCLVVGAGTIGVCVAIVLADRGNRVTLVDTSADRIRTAAQLGFVALAADAAKGSWPLVVECSGARTAPGAAADWCAPGGRLVLCGLPDGASEFDVTTLALRELTVVGTAGHQVSDLAAAVELLLRTPEAARLVTSRVPLESVPDALGRLAGPPAPGQLKVSVVVADEAPKGRQAR